jgi:putative spermidine/putrescine transport system ATP-binding protein
MAPSSKAEAAPLQRQSTVDDSSTDGLLLEGVSKSFGKFVAVDSVDLRVRRGEFLTLLGPSGSGKTTLLMMVAGFLEPTAGTISLDGRVITGLLPEQRNFGMVFQGYALFPHMTVSQNIAYPLEVRRQPRNAVASRVEEMLELVQLREFAGRYPRQLSGGQQQRVALARALSFGPQLLLLDEPLGALDRKLRGEVQEQLKDLHAKTGTTFIYVTHDQDEALSMSDRIVIMNRALIVQVGAPTELYERPNSVFVADFLGKSNFIAVRVEDRQADSLLCEIAGQRLRQRAPARAIEIGASITLALRPEKIGVARARVNAESENGLRARITRISYFGSVLEIQVDAGSIGQLTIHAPAWRNESEYEIGQMIWLNWPEDAAVIVKREGAAIST